MDAFNRFEVGEGRELGFPVRKNRDFLGAVRVRTG